MGRRSGLGKEEGQGDNGLWKAWHLQMRAGEVTEGTACLRDRREPGPPLQLQRPPPQAEMQPR